MMDAKGPINCQVGKIMFRTACLQLTLTPQPQGHDLSHKCEHTPDALSGFEKDRLTFCHRRLLGFCLPDYVRILAINCSSHVCT